MTISRCGWVPEGDTLYAAYHDEEWGVPEYDSRALWEKLMLDGFQAGLAWITILRKRDSLRAAFDDFDPEKIARYGEADIARLMADPGIIRSNAKIAAAVGNARAYLGMHERGEDFSAYLWSFVDGVPVQNAPATLRDVPAKTPVSEALSKALKRRGFKFCGPVIVYAFMQVVSCVPFFKNRRHTITAPIPSPDHVPVAGLARLLYTKRIERRLTKVGLAEELGVLPATIRSWEEGATPSVEHMPAIIAFLGTDDWIPVASFADRLRKLRMKMGWSQEVAAAAIGCSQTSIHEWERGAQPSRSNRIRIERMLADLEISSPVAAE